MMATRSSVLVCCVTYSLALAASCGDVSDLVVLDAAWSWIPPSI